jgi:hypothetical protein
MWTKKVRIPDDVGRNLHLTSSIKKAISKVSDLGLEQALSHWEANSKIYKVTFHKSLLILIFTRSKEPPFAAHLQAI